MFALQTREWYRPSYRTFSKGRKLISQNANCDFVIQFQVQSQVYSSGYITFIRNITVMCDMSQQVVACVKRCGKVVTCLAVPEDSLPRTSSYYYSATFLSTTFSLMQLSQIDSFRFSQLPCFFLFPFTLFSYFLFPVPNT